MSVNRIKAAEGYVEVTVEDKKLKAGLNNAEKQCQNFQKKAEKFGTGISLALTAAFTGIAVAVKKAFSSVVGFGDNLDKMSQRIGVSVESLSRLNVIAQLSGTSLEQMEGSITKMNKALGSATQEGGNAAKVFEQLGLSATELANSNTDEAFLSILSSLSKIGNTSQRTSAAMEIFGKSATQLFPLINSGAKTVDELNAEMNKLGVTMTGEEAKALADFKDATTKIQAALGGLTQHILTALAPSLTSLCNFIKDTIGAISNWTKEHKTLTSVITTAIGVFGTATGAIVAWSLAGAKLVSVLGTLKVALTALSANPWVAGITLGAGAIMLLINAFKKEKPEAEAMMKRAEELAQKHDEQRKADNALIDELSELNEKQNKSALEMKRAEEICGKLNSQYDGLGLSVNKATGAIEGLTEAQKKMNDVQRQMKIADVKAEIAALEQQDKEEGVGRRGHIADLERDIADQKRLGGSELGRDDLKTLQDKLSERKATEEAFQAQLQSRRDYLSALESGGAIEEATTPTADEKSYQSAFDRNSKLAEEAAKIGKKSWELKIEQAEEAYAKAIKDAEEQKKGDIAYGVSEELATNRYNENVSNAQKIRDEAIGKAHEEEQAEIDKANEERLNAEKEALEKERQLKESEQSATQKSYEEGLSNLESLRNKYVDAMKEGRFGEAEQYGKDYQAQKEDLELTKSNEELTTANEELTEAIKALAEAEKSGNADEIIEARNRYTSAQSNVQSAREAQTSASNAIYQRLSEQQREREEAEKQLAESQKEQMRKQEEYNKIIGQDINAGLKTSAHTRGSFNALDLMGSGNTVEERQLKEAERANKWNEKIYRELQEFNRKEMTPVYA